jgi:hypothetical protein
MRDLDVLGLAKGLGKSESGSGKRGERHPRATLHGHVSFYTDCGIWHQANARVMPTVSALISKEIFQQLNRLPDNQTD